jgi:hypothetical protein
MVREPGVRQEFAQPIGGMRRQTLPDILEVRERIDLMKLASSHQVIQDGRRPAAAITPDKQLVFASKGNGQASQRQPSSGGRMTSRSPSRL